MVMVKLNSNQEIIGTDVLDHLGLIAATVDKLGIAKQIDKLLPMTNRAKTTMGQTLPPWSEPPTVFIRGMM